MMTKLLWKFGQNPFRKKELRTEEIVYAPPLTDIPKSNNQVFPSENLVK